MFNTLPSPFLPVDLDLVSAFHMTNVVVPARKSRLRLVAATDRADEFWALAMYRSGVTINVPLGRGGDLAALLWAGKTATGLAVGAAATLFVSPCNQPIPRKHLQVVFRRGESSRHRFWRHNLGKVDLTFYVVRLRTIVPCEDTITIIPNVDRR